MNQATEKSKTRTRQYNNRYFQNDYLRPDPMYKGSNDYINRRSVEKYDALREYNDPEHAMDYLNKSWDLQEYIKYNRKLDKDVNRFFNTKSKDNGMTPKERIQELIRRGIITADNNKSSYRSTV